MKSTVLVSLLFTSILIAHLQTSTTTWILDNVTSIGGLTPVKLNELPTIIETQQGKASLFDGINDGLLMPENPLQDATSFTIEIIIRPDSSQNPVNLEQRFLHIRNLLNDNRRILMELRLLKNQTWSLDTFIKSETSSCTLLDSVDLNKRHQAGKWYHIALVYENGKMRHYIDGKEEMSGNVSYLPIDSNGKTSIGARQDPRSWFKGAIRLIKFTKKALSNSEFIPLTSGIKPEKQLENEFQLYQNFPNPFNPSTIISYNLEKEQNVQLRIFDSIGREVDTLLNRNESRGFHKIEFDASNLSNGIYFYQIVAGNKSLAKRMTLIK